MIYKLLNKKETVFFVFETSTTTFSIYDSKLDCPIYAGNWLMTSKIISNIKKTIKNAVISYYTINKDGTLHYEHFWSQKYKRY